MAKIRMSVKLGVLLPTMLWFCAAGLSQQATASNLGNVASAMTPGTWAELTGMTGWNNGGILSPTDIPGCTSGDYITQYAEKATWDAVNKRILFVGQAHGACYGGRFVIYGEATNTWSAGPWPAGLCQSGTVDSPCFSHAYDHNAINPSNGDLYYRSYGSLKFYRFRNGSWTPLPAPTPSSYQCCGALEYFPELDRLIFIDGDWGVWAFNPNANTWKQLANTTAQNATPGLPNLPMRSLNNFAIYNPVQKILLFGGGTNLYKMNADGSISTLKSSPFTTGVTSTVFSVDSVGGMFIVLAGTSMYQYSAITDSWALLETAVPNVLAAMSGIGDGLIQAPIAEYGVTMYIKYAFGNSKVYLYKHTASPRLQKPMPPANLGGRP